MSKPSTLAEARVVLCSACLLGEACRFDGRDKRSQSVLDAIAGKEVVPICPEVAGGLGVPRAPCSMQGGDGVAVLDGKAQVMTADGRSATEAYLRGATLAVEAARRFGATLAILKDKSPSCGCRSVWIGTALSPGAGVTAAALAREGVSVISSDELEARPK
jgi:uncharacterized protein YbbK (DUF523 family)